MKTFCKFDGFVGGRLVYVYIYNFLTRLMHKKNSSNDLCQKEKAPSPSPTTPPKSGREMFSQMVV